MKQNHNAALTKTVNSPGLLTESTVRPPAPCIPDRLLASGLVTLRPLCLLMLGRFTRPCTAFLVGDSDPILGVVCVIELEDDAMVFIMVA